MKRALRKLKRILVKIIPHNVSYKPSGIYATITDYVNSFRSNPPKYLKLYSAYTSTLAISEDFYTKCAAYMPLPVKAEIPPSFIIEVKDGRLHTDTIGSVAIISHDNKVIGDISYQMGKNKPEENSVFEQSFFTVPKKYTGVAFHLLIGGSGDNNYFHWFFDALPRIHLLQQAGWFHRVDWFIVPSFKRGYQRDSLRLLGIDDKKIIEGHDNTHIQADTLIATTFVRYHYHIPVWACNFLRDQLQPLPSAGKNSYSYIYISRNDSDRRFVINESEVMTTLEEYGFKKFELTPLNFNEQVSLFASAKVIIAPHGAGLGNLVFCKKGTSVIEMFADEYVIPIYYDLANKAGLDYHYLTCESNASALTVGQGMRLDMKVDIIKMKEKLNEVMEMYSAQSSGL